MPKKLIRIKGVDYPVPFVRFRKNDPQQNGRSTVTFLTELEYAAIVALFAEPEDWSVVVQHEPTADGEERPDTVTDCTDHDVLCSIHDGRNGLLEVVMGKMTDSEVLAELLEALK